MRNAFAVAALLAVSCSANVAPAQVQAVLDSAKTASGNPQPLLELARKTFRVGAVLHPDYEPQLRPWLRSIDPKQAHYTLFEQSGPQASQWVRLVVNLDDRSVASLDAVGKTFAR